jgi:hypothetical protein
LDNVKGSEFQGVFFSSIPGFTKGVTFFRYKPWNSWTKPVRIQQIKEMESWDNQCFYWQYDDGVYGLAIPVSDAGYRTTLGTENESFGSKAVSYKDNYKTDSIPSMVVGFGTDLYTLMKHGYESVMNLIGASDNIISKKEFPEALNYIGWCTWNSSLNGRYLNEETILHGVESFTKNNFTLGWLLVDDGWFDHSNSQLRGLKPDTKKFPNGFKPIIQKLKSTYQLKHVGIWHALDGYWNGIDPNSPLGNRYKNELFSWKQNQRIDMKDSPVVSYYFIKPSSDSLAAFYSSLHSYLKSEGFSFVKVDNQSVVERMSPGNYPIGVLAEAMHSKLNASVKKYFNNAMINCMDMTGDAYPYFGSTAVGRSVEDYFPYEQGEDYNLQHGNAAAHIIQGVYNNLYFSQMVYPDLDMFQSHNQNGEFHAIARAINNGPIYITDNVGEQNFDILQKLVLHDGSILRADAPLLPSEDCLFQVQDAKLFKAFSSSNGIGLLGVWNCADADEVEGHVSPADVNSLDGETFAVYESFSNSLTSGDRKLQIPVTLERFGYQLYYIAPLKEGIAPLGLLDKYNAPAAIVNYSVKSGELMVKLKEGGQFAAVIPTSPKQVSINGKSTTNFTFKDKLITIPVPLSADNQTVDILIKL